MTTTYDTTLQQFLTESGDGPFVTLYMPLEKNQNAEKSKLMVRHLTNHAKDVMADAWPETAWAPYGSKLQPLMDEPDLIAGMSGQGLGVITDGTRLYLHDLEYPVAETAMVTAMPQVLPILLDMQRHFEFDLLALQGDSIALYHNAGDLLTKVDLPEDAPLTLKGTLGTEIRGGSLNSVGQGRGRVSYHGHNDKSYEEDIDSHRYYQAVDTYIADNFSKPNKQRLVLIGLPQNIALFRDVSRNQYLSKDAHVEVNPGGMTTEQISQSLDLMRRDATIRQSQSLLELVNEARGRERYAADLGLVIDALSHQAVDTLVIRQGARINGRLLDDELDTSSEIAKHNNLLNDLADLTIAQGGTVQVMPENMIDEPVVALTRYAIEQEVAP